MDNVSIKNYFKPTPKNIQKFFLGLKTIVGLVAGAQFVANNAELAFWLMLAGGVLNELSNFFGSEDQTNG